MGNINSPFVKLDGTTKESIIKDINDLNNTIKQFEVNILSTIAEDTFFLSTHKTFFRKKKIWENIKQISRI